MDRFKGPFRIRVRCKTALSVPNEIYQKFPIIPTCFPVSRNENSLAKPNNLTFAPSRLSLDSSTTAHYVVKTSKRDNHTDIVSTTEAEDEGYNESRMKTTKSSVANTPFFRKFSGQDTELETWEETEEDFCSSDSRTGTRGKTPGITAPTTAITPDSNYTSYRDHVRNESESSISSFKCTSRASSKTMDKNKCQSLRNSASTSADSKQNAFEEKSLEELKQLLCKYQKEQLKQTISANKKQEAVENQERPPPLNFQNPVNVGGRGDGDNNFSETAKFESELAERFSIKNPRKIPMTFSSCSSSSPFLDLKMHQNGEFFPPPYSKNQNQNHIKSWTSLETELIFSQGNPNPILDGRNLGFERNSTFGPFQSRFFEKASDRIPQKVSVGKPVLCDFSRSKFFQAPLRRLPTPWHTRPATPLQKIYGSVVNHMPMDTETQRQKLIRQAVGNGHMYRRIKQATSIYKRKEQLTDFKKHEAFIKFRGPVANIQKRAAQIYNTNSSNINDQSSTDIEKFDSISNQPSFSISISDIDADQANYEDEFELDSNNEDENNMKAKTEFPIQTESPETAGFRPLAFSH